MSDYRLTFPVTALASGLKGMDALRAELQSDATAAPIDALGDPRDASGAIVVFDDPDAPPPVAWYGRPGSATGGDPSLYYIHIRAGRSSVAFEPARHGMANANAGDSAAVLGVWAGDPVP